MVRAIFTASALFLTVIYDEAVQRFIVNSSQLLTVSVNHDTGFFSDSNSMGDFSSSPDSTYLLIAHLSQSEG